MPYTRNHTLNSIHPAKCNHIQKIHIWNHQIYVKLIQTTGLDGGGDATATVMAANAFKPYVDITFNAVPAFDKTGQKLLFYLMKKKEEEPSQN